MNGKRTIAVVPVRMGSTRLPGKTLMPICGKPLLGHLLDRLALATRLDGVVVATSENPENDAIERFCDGRGVACFRGSEDDVLSRITGAFNAMDAQTGVLVFGDTPLIDPLIVDDMIRRYEDGGRFDLIGNDLATTFPPGMEVEVFSVDALRDADRRAENPEIREHGTLFIRSNPDLYDIMNIEADGTCRRPELEIEVDTEEDVQVIAAIVDHFEERIDFTLPEIIAFLDAHPDVREANQHIARRWKEFRADVSPGGNT